MKYDALDTTGYAPIGKRLHTRHPGPGGVLLEKQGSTYTKTFTLGNAQVRMNSEYPLYDGIGSERTVTAANQSVSGTITFEGFGQTVATTGSSGNPYMFKGAWGYRNDGDAGLSHVGARYYDAQVGRFITRDTYLDQHPYLYADHEPINQVDPLGHDAGWAGRATNDPYGSPEMNLIPRPQPPVVPFPDPGGFGMGLGRDAIIDAIGLDDMGRMSGASEIGGVGVDLLEGGLVLGEGLKVLKWHIPRTKRALAGTTDDSTEADPW